MTLDRIIKGKEGEEAAAAFLTGAGYNIIGRNYRTRFGEVDIIAQSGGTIIFVEVKKRLGAAYGPPEDAVDYRKCAKIVKTALIYIRENNLAGANFRFDVISVYCETGTAEIKHLQDAFQSPAKYYL